METLMTELVNTGEMRDARGRRIAAPQQRTELIAAYRASGLTQRAFAQREGIKFHTFATWLKRERHSERPKPAFAEVSTRAALANSPLEVALPNGVVIRGSDVEQLAGLATRLR
jgi:transposase-like protein